MSQAFDSTLRWVAWRNNDSQQCPGHGAVEITGWEIIDRGVRLIGKRPGAEPKVVMVNSAAAVPAGDVGRCTSEGPVLVAVGAGALVAGDRLETQEDEWTLRKSDAEGLWLALGAAQSGRTLAIPAIGGGSGGVVAATVVSSINSGGSGQVRELGANPRTFYAVFDHLGTGAGVSLSAGDQVQVAFQADVTIDPDTGQNDSDRGGYRIIDWPCPEA